MEATLEVTQAAMKLLEARVLGHSDTLVCIALHSAARPPIRTALGSRWVSITIAPPPCHSLQGERACERSAGGRLSSHFPCRWPARLAPPRPARVT